MRSEGVPEMCCPMTSGERSPAQHTEAKTQDTPERLFFHHPALAHTTTTHLAHHLLFPLNGSSSSAVQRPILYPFHTIIHAPCSFYG